MLFLCVGCMLIVRSGFDSSYEKKQIVVKTKLIFDRT